MDVFCPSVTVPSHSAWVGRGADYFMAQAEEYKRRQYDSVSPDHIMFPLVVSQFGAFGPSLISFIRVLHTIAKGRVDEPSWGARHFDQIAGPKY